MLVVMLVACSTPRLPAPPADQTSKLQILGLPNARFWVDESPAAIIQEMMLSGRREQAAAPPGLSGMNSGPVVFLALSPAARTMAPLGRGY
jgi:hypothetical protein